MRSLFFDQSRYMESFHQFLHNSVQHHSIKEFVEKKLPDILSSVGSGKSTINVLGVGSGSGEIDLKILEKIKTIYPGVAIWNEVIEPVDAQILLFKERISKTSNLENVKFTWHKETALEFENRMKTHKEIKKWDFIHMVQVLYYVGDIPGTIRYFMSLLEPGAKLLIIIASGTGGWEMIWKKYRPRLPRDLFVYNSAANIEEILDGYGLKYRSYDVPCELDVTDCFIEGNKTGELLLDFLSMILNFCNTAPLDFKNEFIEDLKKHFSKERNGRYYFNSTMSAIVVEN